jgi:prepilin-type N-terminal cleavage/methylation domain-containing protein
MRSRDGNERGETLIEILISLVVIGVVFGAFFAGIATTSTATKSHRYFVTADAVLRDYAETAKQSVRDTCTSSNTGVLVAVIPAPVPPAGWPPVTAAGLTCPSPTTVNAVDITATLPNGVQKHLIIDVRTP